MPLKDINGVLNGDFRTPVYAKAEPMFTFKTGHDLDLDKIGWYIRGHDSSYGGYPYRMDATIGIPGDMLNAMLKSKTDPKATIAQQLFFYFRGHGIHELSNPSMGQIGRAKGGVKPLSVTYYLKDPFIAYALGAELGYGKGGKLNIDKYQSRLKEAHAMYEKAVKFRENAMKELDKKVADEGYKDAESKENARKDLWEQGYKKEWIKISDEMDKKGMSYVDFHYKGKN